MKFPKYLISLLGLLVAVLTVFVGLKAWNAYAEHYRIGVAVRDRDTITVDGTGKVKATPDIARVALGVQTDGKNVKDTQSENSRKMNAILAAVKALGVEAEDLTTENYSVYPKIDYNNGRQTITGYTVTQNVAVKVRDLDKVGDVLAKAGELGANQIGGIDFTIDEPKILQAQAREKAIEDAREKADVLVGQLGLTIVKVVTFSESSAGTPIPYPMMARDVMLKAEANEAPQIEPGQEEIISNVSVTYEVR